MRTHASKQANLPSKRTLQNLHAVTRREWPPRELDETVTLTCFDVGNSTIRNVGGP
jgi:hypothetical protein